MYEVYNTEFDQLKTALSLARAYHAGVQLAARHRPDDPHVQRRLREAVQEGRSAWSAYQQAAKAGLVEQLEDIMPSDFQED